MKIVKGTRHFEGPKYDNLKALLQKLGTSDKKNKPAFMERLVPGSKPISTSFKEVYERVNALGTALTHDFFKEDLEQVNPLRYENMDRRRIAIIGDNSSFYFIAQNAIILGGDMVVPLDKQLSIVEVGSLLERARVNTIFIGANKKELIDHYCQSNNQIKNIILMGHIKDESVYDFTQLLNHSAPTTDQATTRIFKFADLLAYGQSQLEQNNTAFTDLVQDNKAPASIFFTSGTTARSKGVVLCQANILQVLYMCHCNINLPSDGMVLSVLPVHHTLENSGQYTILDHYNTIFINDGLRYLSKNIKELPITFIVTVPMLLDHIKQKVEVELKKKGVDKVIKTLRYIVRNLRKIGIDLRKPVFAKIREAINPNIELFIVGASALKNDTLTFFDDLGMVPYVGYGLTETAPLLTANNQVNWEKGSVGEPFTDVELKIDTDGDPEAKEGEVVVRCPNLMLGYYEDQEATDAVIDKDRWFRTGDVGYLDKRNMLHLTGRAKSMIVLTNGKKVFPEEIENILSQNDWVEQLMVFGSENQRQNIDVNVLFQFNKKSYDFTNAEVMAELKNKIEKLVETANKQLPPYKAIRYWAITCDELVMTSTLKIKRQPTKAKLDAMLNHNNQDMQSVHGSLINLDNI